MNARDWYERQREGLDAAFQLCVEEVPARIGHITKLDTAVHHHVRRAWTRRFPYAMYYRIADTEVTVLGILHMCRDPREWQPRA